MAGNVLLAFSADSRNRSAILHAGPAADAPFRNQEPNGAAVFDRDSHPGGSVGPSSFPAPQSPNIAFDFGVLVVFLSRISAGRRFSGQLG